MTDGLERLCALFRHPDSSRAFFRPFFCAIRAAKDYTGLNACSPDFPGERTCS